MTDDEVVVFLPDGSVLQEHRPLFLQQYEAFDEPWYVNLLVKWGIFHRHYKWLTFNERFIVYTVENAGKVMSYLELLEIDRLIDLGILPVEKKRIISTLMHVQRIEVAQCFYSLGKHEIKYIYGKVKI
jgi:hypothetical protein